MRAIFTAIGRILSILFFTILTLAVVGPFVASQIYLERSGINTTGTVVGKGEQIQNQTRSNNWSRRLTLQIRFVPLDDPNEIITSLPVDLAIYDSYDVGARVEVRYAPDTRLRHWGIFGVKLAEQPPFAFLSTFTDDDNWIVVALGILGLLAVWLMFRTKSVVLRFGLGTMLVALIGIAFIISLRPAAIFEPGPRETAMARVIDVERIMRAPRGRRNRIRSNNELVRPIDRVRLEFTPLGKASGVIAVDDIDADSIAGIAEGQERAISYPVANPRSAHLVGATYQHRWQNWLLIPRTILFLTIAGGILALFGWLFRRLVRRRAAGRVTS